MSKLYVSFNKILAGFGPWVCIVKDQDGNQGKGVSEDKNEAYELALRDYRENKIMNC